MPTPVGDVDRHEGLEQTAVVGNTKMQQLVGHDEILKPCDLVFEIGRQRNGAPGLTGTPLAGHPLDTHHLGLDLELGGPALDPSL